MSRDKEDEQESLGSDLEQMIAMLERAEIDYDADYEDEEETIVDINGDTRMTFDEDGNLTGVSPIPN